MEGPADVAEDSVREGDVGNAFEQESRTPLHHPSPGCPLPILNQIDGEAPRGP